MGDRIARPVDGDQVDLVELAQVEGALVVARLEVLVARAIGEITDVVQGDEIALAGGVGKHRDVGLPVALVRGLDRGPPKQHEHEEERKGDQRPTAAKKQEHADGQQGEAHRQADPERLAWQIRIVQGEHRPARHAGDQKGEEGFAQRAQCPSNHPVAHAPRARRIKVPLLAISAGSNTVKPAAHKPTQKGSCR